MDEPAILDASPIILLARSGFLHLLRVLDRPLLVPQPVAEEVLLKGPDDVAAKALRQTELFTSVQASEVDPSVARWNLGRGETAVLSLARKRPGSLVVLDDLQARRCAEWLEIPTSGTIGVVLKAKGTGLVDSARSVLQQLISVGMHLSDRTLNAVLLRVGE